MSWAAHSLKLEVLEVMQDPFPPFPLVHQLPDLSLSLHPPPPALPPDGNASAALPLPFNPTPFCFPVQVLCKYPKCPSFSSKCFLVL